MSNAAHITANLKTDRTIKAALPMRAALSIAIANAAAAAAAAGLPAIL